MAQFYAEISGARGPASRLGTKASGLRTTTKSWAGEVNVSMWHDDKSDTDMVYVTLGRHGGGTSVVLFTGPVDTWEMLTAPIHPPSPTAECDDVVGELGKQALVLERMPLVKHIFQPTTE